METIGEKIKYLREKNNYSTKELSQLSGVARGYLHELESGKYNNPTVEVICKICKALNVTPNNLIPVEMYKNENEK